MEKILTVVIPAYNAEAYLENCLDSLCLSDLLDCLDIIVVNDGSTDHTGKIADRYQMQFPGTVRVIHKENGGHGSGINCGIKAAYGRYFKVVDADDWVEPEEFRNLVSYLRKMSFTGTDWSGTFPDAVVSGFYWALDNGSGKEETFRRKAEIRKPFSGVCYGKIYDFDQVANQIYIKMHALTIRTELLQQHRIQVDEKCFYVDTEYILYPVPFLKTIVFIPDFVYQYRIGRQGQSMDPSRMVKLETDYDRVLDALLKFYNQCGESLECSCEKCDYIARMIARVVAGKIKILLSLPYGKESKKKLIIFERKLKQYYPVVYAANKNRAVHVLRLSRYHLYPIAYRLLDMKNRRG